jgi:GT2 family glycosyltransferase
MSVSAIIPVHNRADLLEKLLVTVHRQTVPFDDVLVIDNASTDGVVQVARAAGCEVIAMGANAGFAAAVNRGWRAAKGDWIAILNSDVELDPAWLEHLLDALTNAASGNSCFATGKIFRAAAGPLTIDGTYDLLARSGCAWRAGHGQPDRPSETEPRSISIAPATACLFRRSVLDALNGFDESFGSYLEDVDLGLRCLEHGFAGIYVPRACASHHGSATLGRWNPQVVRLISRNQLRLVAKHCDRALFRANLWPILAGQLLWGCLALRHGAFSAWLRGKREALRDFHLEGRPSAALTAFLEASECEIEHAATDAYWSLYFRCVPRREA